MLRPREIRLFVSTLVMLGAALAPAALFAQAAAPAAPEASAPAAAPAPATAPAAASPAAEGPKLSRADLAAAYLAFERVYASRPPAPEKTAEANQAFDQATLAFFGGRQAEAIRGINELAARLAARGQEPTLQRRIAGSLRAVVEPRVTLAAEIEKAMLRVESLYPMTETSAGMPRLELLARLRGGRTSLSHPLAPTLAKEGLFRYEQPMVDPGTKLPPGTYDLYLLTADGQGALAGFWVVTSETFSAQRAKLELRLSAAKTETPELQSTAAAVRARLALLTDTPSAERSAEFTADPHELATQIAREVVLIEEGKNPFARRSGDYWRPIAAGGKEIAARVFAPEAAREDEPLPLVVALHGAGGDENMFMDGYGAGKIKKLAEAKGFVVASPRTETVMQTPEAFEAILAEMSRDFSIDPARIYVLGHSMGAGAAASLAGKHAAKIAAVVCMAGGRGFDAAAALPPTLVIAGELDPLAQPARLAPPAKAAAEKGLPVEYREIKGAGHTLLVADQLEPAIDWLLERKLK